MYLLDPHQTGSSLGVAAAGMAVAVAPLAGAQVQPGAGAGEAFSTLLHKTGKMTQQEATRLRALCFSKVSRCNHHYGLERKLVY